VRTSFEGRFLFEHVPLGSYFLYSRYKTNFNDGYWIVPVVAVAERGVDQDLASFNMHDLLVLLRYRELEEARGQIDSLVQRLPSNERLAVLGWMAEARQRGETMQLPELP